MSEKEILECFNELGDSDFCDNYYGLHIIKAIQGLLDLYKKEKQKNKELIDITQSYNAMITLDAPDDYIVCFASAKYFNNGYFKQNFISKDKIREIIKHLEKEQEENRKNLSLGIELLSNTIIDKFSDKIMINLGIREYLENIIKGEKTNG